MPEWDHGGDVDRIALDDEPSRELVGVWEHMIGFSFLAIQIAPERTRAFLAELDRTDAVMPLIDPTAYRGIMGNIRDYRGVAEAFLAFQEACLVAAEHANKREKIDGATT